MRSFMFIAAIALPAVAQADWAYTDTYTVASAPSEGMRLVVDCSRPGGEAQFRLDGFSEIGADGPYTGPTAFLTGPDIEDVYGAECTSGSCVLGPAPNLPADQQAAQMPALAEAWRSAQVFEVTVYRGGAVGAFDMTGSAAVIAELEGAGCTMP